MIGLGLSAALIGLSTVVIAVAALVRTWRFAVLLVGMAAIIRVWTWWSRANPTTWSEAEINFLIWEGLILFLAQIGSLVAALSIARIRGWRLGTTISADEPRTGGGLLPRWRLSIRDGTLLILSAALFLASLRTLVPVVNLPTVLYLLNAVTGVGVAGLCLVVLWATFGGASRGVRGAALILVAPVGGPWFLSIDRLNIPGVDLLFNAPFYAGVTTVQVIGMAAPCLVLRAGGCRFRRARSEV